MEIKECTCIHVFIVQILQQWFRVKRVANTYRHMKTKSTLASMNINVLEKGLFGVYDITAHNALSIKYGIQAAGQTT